MNHAIEIVTDDDSPTIRCERPSFERVSRHSLVACAIPVLPSEHGVSAGNGADAGRSTAAVETTRRAPKAPSILASLREWVRVKLGLSRHITFAELRVIAAAEREHEAERAWSSTVMDPALLKAWGEAKTELEHAVVAMRKERGR